MESPLVPLLGGQSAAQLIAGGKVALRFGLARAPSLGVGASSAERRKGRGLVPVLAIAPEPIAFPHTSWRNAWHLSGVAVGKRSVGVFAQVVGCRAGEPRASLPPCPLGCTGPFAPSLNMPCWVTSDGWVGVAVTVSEPVEHYAGLFDHFALAFRITITHEDKRVERMVLYSLPFATVAPALATPRSCLLKCKQSEQWTEPFASVERWAGVGTAQFRALPPAALLLPPASKESPEQCDAERVLWEFWRSFVGHTLGRRGPAAEAFVLALARLFASSPPPLSANGLLEASMEEAWGHRASWDRGESGVGLVGALLHAWLSARLTSAPATTEDSNPSSKWKELFLEVGEGGETAVGAEGPPRPTKGALLPSQALFACRDEMLGYRDLSGVGVVAAAVVVGDWGLLQALAAAMGPTGPPDALAPFAPLPLSFASSLLPQRELSSGVGELLGLPPILRRATTPPAPMPSPPAPLPPASPPAIAPSGLGVSQLASTGRPSDAAPQPLGAETAQVESSESDPPGEVGFTSDLPSLLPSSESPIAPNDLAKPSAPPTEGQAVGRITPQKPSRLAPRPPVAPRRSFESSGPGLDLRPKRPAPIPPAPRALRVVSPPGSPPGSGELSTSDESSSLEAPTPQASPSRSGLVSPRPLVAPGPSFSPPSTPPPTAEGEVQGEGLVEHRTSSPIPGEPWGPKKSPAPVDSPPLSASPPPGLSASSSVGKGLDAKRDRPDSERREGSEKQKKSDEEKKRLDEEKKRLDEEKKRLDEEKDRRKKEKERKLKEDKERRIREKEEKKRQEEEKKRLDEDKRRQEAKKEEERKRLEEEKKRVEKDVKRREREEKKRIEEEKKRQEEDRRRQDEERRRQEKDIKKREKEEKRRQEEEKKRVEKDRKRRERQEEDMRRQFKEDRKKIEEERRLLEKERRKQEEERSRVDRETLRKLEKDRELERKRLQKLHAHPTLAPEDSSKLHKVWKAVVPFLFREKSKYAPGATLWSAASEANASVSPGDPTAARAANDPFDFLPDSLDESFLFRWVNLEYPSASGTLQDFLNESPRWLDGLSRRPSFNLSIPLPRLRAAHEPYAQSGLDSTYPFDRSPNGTVPKQSEDSRAMGRLGKIGKLSAPPLGRAEQNTDPADDWVPNLTHDDSELNAWAQVEELLEVRALFRPSVLALAPPPAAPETEDFVRPCAPPLPVLPTAPLQPTRHKFYKIRHVGESATGQLFSASFHPPTLKRTGAARSTNEGWEEEAMEAGVGEVWLKVLPPSLALSAQLNLHAYLSDHPNFVRLLGMEEEGGRVGVGMEWMDGGSAEDLIFARHGSALPEPLIAYIVHQILTALVYLHEEVGCLHGGVTGRNVLFDLHGAVKLTDLSQASPLPPPSRDWVHLHEHPLLDMFSVGVLVVGLLQGLPEVYLDASPVQFPVLFRVDPLELNGGLNMSGELVGLLEALTTLPGDATPLRSGPSLSDLLRLSIFERRSGPEALGRFLADLQAPRSSAQTLGPTSPPKHSS